MSKTVRAFWAFDLPNEVKQNIMNLQENLRKDFPYLRWVKMNNIHLTLHFLGNIAPCLLESMAQEINSLVDKKRFPSFRIGSLGTFPAWHKPRVLWLSLQGNLTLLQEFYDLAGEKISAMGIKLERRPFSPHITIARIPQDYQQRDISLLQEVDLSDKSFFLPSVTLYTSKLSPHGALYTPVFSFALQ